MKKNIFALASLLVISTAHTACPNILYEATLPNSTPIISPTQLKQALQIVTNRLTPREHDLTNPIILEAAIEPLIASQHYSSQKVRSICFKPEAINQLMTNAGQQPWITTRPKVLTWLLRYTEKASVKTLVNLKKNNQLRPIFESAAAEKGLQLVYHDLTPEEQSYFKNRIVTLDALIKLQKPGPNEAVLLIKLNDNNPPYLREEAAAYYHGTQGDSYDEQLNYLEHIGKLSMATVARVAFQAGEKKAIPPATIAVRISNINTLHAYNKMNDYLEKIPGVLSTSVNSVTADSVLYTIELEIPQAVLEKRLAQEFDTLTHDIEEGILRYRSRDHVKKHT